MKRIEMLLELYRELQELNSKGSKLTEDENKRKFEIGGLLFEINFMLNEIEDKLESK